MEGFMVETTKVNNCAYDIQGYGDRIKDLQESVRSIRTGMRHKLSARGQIERTLRGIEERMLDEVALMSSLDQALEHIVAFYRDTERKLVDQGILEKHKVAGTPIFDGSGNGGYGGDQGNLDKNHNGWNIFGWDVWFEDKDVYTFVKTHEGYEGYTDVQIHELIEQMNKEGCGYIGIVNAIFAEYEGSEEEFEKLFGFPMRDKEGDYNYDYMFIDLYCTTDNKYYLDKAQGVNALTGEILASYEDAPDSFLDKYGVELSYEDENGKLQYNEDAILAVIDDVNSTYDSQDVVTFDESRDGLNVLAQENHLIAYLHEKGIDSGNISYDSSTAMDTATIKSNLDDGKIMQVLLLAETEMYQDKGKTMILPGNHYVTITGVTDDGRYMISSWGKKYYIDPGQAKVSTYQTIDLELER